MEYQKYLMFHNEILIIKPDAIFISDAHYNPSRKDIIDFLKAILDDKIHTSQLFLMGDIFDFLAGEIDYFKTQNQELISLIDELSSAIEVIFLEGNHDYNLQGLFTKTKIITRNNQPLQCEFWDSTKLQSDKKTRKIMLAHGDIFTPKNYNIYTAIIRNKRLLKFLNFIDFFNWLTKRIDLWLRKKELSCEFKDFNNFAIKRLMKYKYAKADLIIEGHFHQGKSYKNYTNLPAFGIENQYFSFKDKKIFKFIAN